MERNAIAQMSVRQQEQALFRRQLEEERRHRKQIPGVVVIDTAGWTERLRQLRERTIVPPMVGTSWRQRPSVQ